MALIDKDYEWQCKGSTLSDKTAREEFELTQDEILRAIRALIRSRHGGGCLKDLQAKQELTRIDRELKRLKRQIADLEKRKSQLTACSSRRKR
jgi:predicted translin family RNA/ssDNA-binding protein